MKKRETFYFTIEELLICLEYNIDRKKMKKLIHQALLELKEKTEA